jgi:hypothetical protein
MVSQSGRAPAERRDGVGDSPSNITPRGITRQQAADYCCGGSVSTFDDWQRRGIVPGPIPNTKRWDIKAIDAALDRASGLISVAEDQSDYAKWKSGARPTQRHQQGSAPAR